MAMSTAVAGPARWLTIGRGSVTYTQAEAEAVLAGFAFGTEQLIWPNSFTLPADPGIATGPRAIMRHTWSYRIFDCAPSSPYGFTVHDLLVIAALNPRATASDYLQMEAILPDLNEALAAYRRDPDLLDAATSPARHCAAIERDTCMVAVARVVAVHGTRQRQRREDLQDAPP